MRGEGWRVEQTSREFVSWEQRVWCGMVGWGGLGVEMDGGGRVGLEDKQGWKWVRKVEYNIITPLSTFSLFHLPSASPSLVISDYSGLAPETFHRRNDKGKRALEGCGSRPGAIYCYLDNHNPCLAPPLTPPPP